MPCSIADPLARIIDLYVIIMLVYAVVSWIPSLRGRWTTYIAMLVEPVLQPVRRIIPPLGGLDVSFIVVILLLQFAASELVSHCLF